MFAAAAGHVDGVSASVGKEFADADPGGKPKAKDMAPSKWAKLKDLVAQWLTEEEGEAEHQADDEQPTTRAAGVAFVTPSGEILFLRRAARGYKGDHSGEWCLPGGVVENGETPEQAAVREAKEETGYVSAHPDGSDLTQAHAHTLDGVHFTTFYQPVADQFVPTLNEEHTDHRWAHIDAAPDPLHPGVRATIDEIVGGLGEDAEFKEEDHPRGEGGKFSTIEHAEKNLAGRKILAHHMDDEGYVSSITHEEGTQPSGQLPGYGSHHITSPEGVTLTQEGGWKNLPEKEWNLTKSEWDSMPLEERAKLETRQQATAYAPLREQLAQWQYRKTPESQHHSEMAVQYMKEAQEHYVKAAEHKYAGNNAEARKSNAEYRKYKKLSDHHFSRSMKPGAKDSGLTPGANGHLTVGRQRDPNGGFGWAIGGKVGTGRNQMRMSRVVKSGQGAANVARDEQKHDPKTGQFASGEGAAGFGDMHKGYGKNEMVDSHGLEESAPHTVAEYAKAFASAPQGSYEHQALNKVKSRLSKESAGSSNPVHHFGPIEATHKIIRERLKAQHGTPQRSAETQRTAAMSRYLKDKVGGRAKDSSISSDMALDHALASDKRVYDRDGHLHVDRANISKAAVNPYLGSEINGVMRDEPGWRMLDPDRRYNLLRHPEELRKAVGSFNGKPILFTHSPASATDHPSDITVGAAGNDASYEHPYMRNSLSIWPAYASEAIDDGSQKQISAGYAYRADMTPGTYEGERYDGVMRDIVCNHLALVREGRAGADVAIDRALIGWRGVVAAIRELRN